MVARARLHAAQDWGDDVSEDGSLAKVVLARATDVRLTGRVDPLALLGTLQQRDPRAYQLALTLGSGASFATPGQRTLHLLEPQYETPIPPTQSTAFVSCMLEKLC